MLLLDTNIILRYANANDPQHSLVLAVVNSLTENVLPCFFPQNAYEFWTVATRPMANRGFGWTTTQTESELQRLKMEFQFLYDVPAMYDGWERLVSMYQCKGKVSYDARLVAGMVEHGVRHILTFNVADFTRYPGITVLDPNSFLPSP